MHAGMVLSAKYSTYCILLHPVTSWCIFFEMDGQTRITILCKCLYAPCCAWGYGKYPLERREFFMPRSGVAHALRCETRRRSCSRCCTSAASITFKIIMQQWWRRGRIPRLAVSSQHHAERCSALHCTA